MYNQKLNIGSYVYTSPLLSLPTRQLMPLSFFVPPHSCLSIFRSLLLPTYADDEVQAHIGVKDLHQNFMG